MPQKGAGPLSKCWGAEAGPTRNAEGHSILERGLCSQAGAGGDAAQFLDGQIFAALLCFSFSVTEQPQGLSVADNGKVKVFTQSGWTPQAKKEGGTLKGTLCPLPWAIGTWEQDCSWGLLPDPGQLQGDF